jgi:hypothetical protein
MQTWYVYYDDDEYITCVTNEIKEFGNFYECPEEIIIDFLKGTKRFAAHKIRVKNCKDLVIEEVKHESYIPIYKDIFVLQNKNLNDSLMLKVIHDLQNKCWKFELGEDFKKTFQDNQYYKVLSFFICNSEDYNLLYRKIEIETKSLLNNNIVSPFVNKIEETPELLAVITRKYIDQIGVIHV